MWSRSRAKVTAPATAKYPSSGSETLIVRLEMTRVTAGFIILYSMKMYNQNLDRQNLLYIYPFGKCLGGELLPA